MMHYTSFSCVYVSVLAYDHACIIHSIDCSFIHIVGNTCAVEELVSFVVVTVSDTGFCFCTSFLTIFCGTWWYSNSSAFS